MGNRAIAPPTSATRRNRAPTKTGAVPAVLLMLKLTLVLALATALLSPAAGVARAQSDPNEAEAQAIDRMLMCPVCPAQTIDQTEVPLAKQMRAQVRELLDAGASRNEILDWFRERYGPGIVAEPPRSGINLIAWIVPGVVIVLALAGGLFVLRAMRRRPDDAGAAADLDTNAIAADSEPEDLQPWLAAVDRDLALDRQPGHPGQDDRNG